MTFARGALLLLLVIVVIAASGTARVLPAYNTPKTYRLRLVDARSVPLQITVMASQPTTFPVAADGRVLVEVPVLPRRCCWRCYGLTVSDGSPKTRRTVLIRAGEKVVRRFSLKQLDELRSDSNGELVIRLDP